MENFPLVSILIPVYNRELMIEECINSALNQTYKNIEIIVVDNDSNDNTYQICKHLASKYKEIKLHKNVSNIGPVKNWKKAIDLAKGRYAKILFSDDIIFPEFIEKTIELINNDTAFVFSSVLSGPTIDNSKLLYHYPKKKLSENYFSSDFYIKKALFDFGALVSPGAALFRLSDLKDSYVEDIPSPTLKKFWTHGAGTDLLFFLLTALKYKKVGYVSRPFAFFREHLGSTTTEALINKSWSIRACYTQTRVWFADRYLNHDIVSKLIARAYIIEVIQEKDYQFIFMPYSFTKKYLQKLNNFSILIFLYSLPIFFFKGLRYFLKKK